MPCHTPPRRVIRYAGKTGFISRGLWTEFFSSDGKERWLRQQWEDLRTRGYFLPHPERHVRDVYVLNRANPVVKELLDGDIVSPQRATYFKHDETLYRGVLRALRSGFVYDWKSEPELKAAKRQAYRIESTDGSVKYPDALLFSVRDTEAKPIAIECELTLKSSRRYGQIMSAYAAMKDLGPLIFVTDYPAIEAAVRKAMYENHYDEDSPPVQFVTVDDWTMRTHHLFEPLCRDSAATAPNNAGEVVHANLLSH